MSFGIQNPTVRTIKTFFFAIPIYNLCLLTSGPGQVISLHTDISVVNRPASQLPRLLRSGSQEPPSPRSFCLNCP